MKLIYVEDEGSLWTAVNEINWTMKWNWIVKLIEWAAAGGPAQENSPIHEWLMKWIAVLAECPSIKEKKSINQIEFWFHWLIFFIEGPALPHSFNGVWFGLLSWLPAAVMGASSANGLRQRKRTQTNKPNGMEESFDLWICDWMGMNEQIQ